MVIVAVAEIAIESPTIILPGRNRKENELRISRVTRESEGAPERREPEKKGLRPSLWMYPEVMDVQGQIGSSLQLRLLRQKWYLNCPSSG